MFYSYLLQLSNIYVTAWIEKSQSSKRSTSQGDGLQKFFLFLHFFLSLRKFSSKTHAPFVACGQQPPVFESYSEIQFRFINYPFCQIPYWQFFRFHEILFKNISDHQNFKTDVITVQLCNLNYHVNTRAWAISNLRYILTYVLVYASKVSFFGQCSDQ